FEAMALAEADVRGLSPGEIVAIYNYTTDDFSKINQWCRDPNSIKPETREKYKKKVEVTKQALANLPPYQGGMTMRGEIPWDEDKHKEVCLVGRTFAIPMFWSTGVKMSLGAPIQISVFGKTGKDIAAMSAKAQETEVLFAPGTKFKVIAVTGTDDEKMF